MRHWRRSRRDCSRRERRPAQRLELRRRAEQVDVLFSRLPTSGDDPAFRFAVHSHHVQLHMCIAEHAGSRLLTQMIERNHVLILNWLFDVTGRRSPLPSDFHARLVESLVAGDPEAADAAMRAHIRYGLAEITGSFSALAASVWRERRVARPPRHTPSSRSARSAS